MHTYSSLSTVRNSFLSRSLGWLFSIALGYFLLGSPSDRALAMTDSPDWNRSGSLQFQQGNYTDALHHFTEAIEQGINTGTAYGNRCLVRIHLQDYVNAWQDCTRSLQQRSNSFAYFHRGLAFYRLGHSNQAIADYDRSIQLQPTDYRTYYNRGLARAKNRDYTAAIDDFNQSLRQMTGFEPTSLSSIYSDRGASYLSLGNLRAAKADIARSLSLDPHHTGAYYHRACMNRQLQHFSEAIDDFNRVLALDPTLTDARVQRGLLFYQLGYARSALTDLQQGAEDFFQRGQEDNYHSVLALIERLQNQLSIHANRTV
jgi:tetratricopeptide (TPR) repeat protein